MRPGEVRWRCVSQNHKRVIVVMLLACLGGCASEGNRHAQLRSDGAFVYPAAAKQAHTEGYVVVAFDIDANGRVEAPHPRV